MKQILQNLKTGQLEIADVPVPVVRPGHLLIKTRCSLISSGTERMLVSFAKSSLLGKARQQPDKVKQVINKLRTDGLLPTMHSVFARLDEPLPLGYCNCGTVLEVGDGVEDFKPGDRVANNGPHAEIVCVPKNLCAKVPDNVSDEQAVFTVLASIGLQGTRLIKPMFGETIVVFGLGLIGLICVQLLKNCGCKVIGIDIDSKKLELAAKDGGVSRQEIADACSVSRAVAAGLIKNSKLERAEKKGRTEFFKSPSNDASVEPDATAEPPELPKAIITASVIAGDDIKAEEPEDEVGQLDAEIVDTRNALKEAASKAGKALGDWATHQALVDALRERMTSLATRRMNAS